MRYVPEDAVGVGRVIDQTMCVQIPAYICVCVCVCCLCVCTHTCSTHTRMYTQSHTNTGVCVCVCARARVTFSLSLSLSLSLSVYTLTYIWSTHWPHSWYCLGHPQRPQRNTWCWRFQTAQWPHCPGQRYCQSQRWWDNSELQRP